MILYPAIDIKDGQVVRLLRGEMEHATVFGDDPAAQARRFAEQGFTWLHLVDLNGAVEGKPVNAGVVEAILAAVKLPVQLGGGIRDLATIEAWLSKGVSRVVLGTVALKKPANCTPAVSPWGLTHAMALSPWPAGWRLAASRRWISPYSSKMPV